MSALNDLLCKVGLHPWKKEAFGGKCCGVARCPNCLKNNYDLHGFDAHLWGDWAPTAGKCEEVRRCSRDHYLERRPTHVWGEWLPTPDQCEETRTCSRCGSVEERPVDHTWGEWMVASNECIKYRACPRCGEREKRPADHDWSEWQLFEGKCQGTRACKRCKKSETRWTAHQWTDQGSCSHCGETQDNFSHLKGGLALLDDHYSGCKLKAIVDLRANCVCSIVVEFKNAAVSRQLAEAALNYWRPILSKKGYILPKTLTSQEWRTAKPLGSPYQEMSLAIPRHDVEGCYSDYY